MESAKSGQRTVAGRPRRSGTLAGPGADRLDRTNNRALGRPSKAARHATFAEEVLRELDPRGPLERLVADHVVHSAWKLKTNLEGQGARDRADESDPDALPKARTRATQLERAARAMRDALETLDSLRARARPPRPELNLVAEAVVEYEPNEWPVVPGDGPDEGPETLADAEPDVASWHERLVFDFEVSDVSPVVRGTWVTVAYVVSLIVDGWAWSDILRSHPELNEDDIRTCVAYAMADDGPGA